MTQNVSTHAVASHPAPASEQKAPATGGTSAAGKPQSDAPRDAETSGGGKAPAQVQPDGR